MQYSQHRYWSVIHGFSVARLSIADERGAEHFAIVPTEAVRGDEHRVAWRDRRDKALAAIADHIEAGQPAGQLELDA